MAIPDIKTFVLGDYQTNCFVVSNPGSSEAWIVDCGFEPDPMLDWIDTHGAGRGQPTARGARRRLPSRPTAPSSHSAPGPGTW